MIKPMLCKLHTRPFNSPSWVWERKYDGVRMLAMTGPVLQLQARSGTDKTLHFPELDIQTRVPAILDGEVICAMGFQVVQARVNRIKNVDTMALGHPATYRVFDVLECDGESVRDLPLIMRKRLLNNILGTTGSAYRVEHHEDGIKLWEWAQKLGWEGIVGKELEGPYRDGKRDWIKVKTWHEGEYWAVGYTDGTGKRSSLFGALALTDDQMNYMGMVGTGFDNVTLVQLMSYITLGSCTVAGGWTGHEGTIHWVVPFRVKIKYLEVTNAGLLRLPVYMGVV